ncbi:hypothetical protein GCM10028807_28810 [Spirosoma daeguense]
MHKLHIAITVLIALLLGGLVSCQQSVDPGLDTSAIFAANQVDIENYRVSKGLSGTLTSSGMYYVTSKPSTSTVTPTDGQEVDFNYRMYVLTRSTSNTAVVTEKLIDTTKFNTPAYFALFPNALLPGFEEGIRRMKEGEQAVLLIPSILAYGSAATGDIPANSSIRVDIKLNRVRTENQQIDDYIAANKLTVTELTTNGVRIIKTVTNATGETPTAGKTLTIKFAGKLLRATTGFAGGTGTDTKTVGVNKYVPGFEEGLSKLKVGEKATVIFPSTLGYGANGAAQNGTYVIPPYSPIAFDLEVVSAQ